MGGGIKLNRGSQWLEKKTIKHSSQKSTHHIMWINKYEITERCWTIAKELKNNFPKCHPHSTPPLIKAIGIVRRLSHTKNSIGNPIRIMILYHKVPRGMFDSERFLFVFNHPMVTSLLWVMISQMNVTGHKKDHKEGCWLNADS